MLLVFLAPLISVESLLIITSGGKEYILRGDFNYYLKRNKFNLKQR
jgi:hypothetical protein